MKTNFNTRFLGSAAASCVLGLTMTPHSPAVVSDEDFNALKTMVQQMNQQMADLKKTHEQDQQQVQQLKQQVGDTATVANNAAEKANAVVPTSQVRNAFHNVTLVGDAEVQYGRTFGDNSHSGFLLADYAPIFLYQANEKILFEAGFDVKLQNGNNPDNGHASGSSTSIGLSFAQLDYVFNDYITFVGGYMLLPLGTYSERSAGFLNKIPDSPFGRDFLPGAGAGAQLRGAFAIGESGQALTYSVYSANGPSSSDGFSKASSLDLGGNVGINSDGSGGNLHSAPSGGGRLGWFVPWGAHKDLELGVSGQSGEWDDAGKHTWSAGVLDAALHLGSNFELKGEFINSWYGTSDAGNVHQWAVWAQAGYKLAAFNLDLPFVNNVELIGRFDKANNGLGTKSDRYTLGYVYYLSNTLMFEGDYEFIHSSGPNALPSNYLVFQLSYGF